MNPRDVFCPNEECPARGRCGEGTIGTHARTPLRYRCRVCGKTFGARVGTPFYRRHTDEATMTTVLTPLAHGCPVAAIVIAFGVRRQTVGDWLDAAGRQGGAVHRHLVLVPRDLGQVQADELRVRRQGGVVWMAMAMMVSTRLWLGGVVSPHRDGALIRRLMLLVHAAALPAPILLCVDGFAAYVGAFLAITRTPEAPTGRRGRPRLCPWAGVVIGQVVKQRVAQRVVSVTRRLVHGSEAELMRLLPQGQQIHTAYIERVNATFRARLGTLTRRTRGLARRETRLHRGMYLLGAVYNFCTPHASLGRGQTPAMAAAITDHVWSMGELLRYPVPPAPWRPPPQRGRRSKERQRLIARWCQ
jgi:transposase-like protein